MILYNEISQSFEYISLFVIVIVCSRNIDFLINFDSGIRTKRFLPKKIPTATATAAVKIRFFFLLKQ